MVSIDKISDKQELLKKLDDYRKIHDLSQERLARLLGISFMTVNLWAKRKVLPNNIQVNRINRLLSNKQNTRQVIVCVINRKESDSSDAALKLNKFLDANNYETVIKYVLIKEKLENDIST